MYHQTPGSQPLRRCQTVQADDRDLPCPLPFFDRSLLRPLLRSLIHSLPA